MGWIEEYDRQLEVKLKRRLAHDFPLLETSVVSKLYEFLVADGIVFDKATMLWLEDQMGSTIATQKFLQLYWPSRMAMYIKLLDGRKRRDRQQPPRNRPSRPQDA